MPEPRGVVATTLAEACLNPDGKTYDGTKLLSWLSEIACPGKGATSAEVKVLFDVARKKL